MRLSWSLIENDPQIRSKTGKQRVIINALPDFVIENSKNLLEHCNLDGAALENQTISQIRASLTPDTGNTVLVDFGANQTTFSIIVEGVLRSSSHIPTGSSQINEYLGEDLGLDNTTTEYLKYDLSLINLYTLPDPVKNVLTELKSELQTFIDLNKKVAQKPGKVVFTGGGVYIAGFLEFFQDMDIPVYISNPSRQVKISNDYRPYISPLINQLSTAIGLAIRSDI
jgi:cell division ATPase FtsA